MTGVHITKSSGKCWLHVSHHKVPSNVRFSVPLQPILTTSLNRSSSSAGECGFIAEQAACGVKDHGDLGPAVAGPWLGKQAIDMGPAEGSTAADCSLAWVSVKGCRMPMWFVIDERFGMHVTLRGVSFNERWSSPTTDQQRIAGITICRTFHQQNSFKPPKLCL